MCEIIEFEGKKLKAVDREVRNCRGCFFQFRPRDCGACCPEERDDGRNVIFVEVIDHSKTLLPADEFDNLVSQLEGNSKEPTPLMKEILELSLEDTFKVKKAKHD